MLTDLEAALKLYARGLVTLRLPVVILLAESPDYMLPMARIAEATGVGVASLSESSRAWEKAGIISRVTPAADMRSTTLRLTPTGYNDAKLFGESRVRLVVRET